MVARRKSKPRRPEPRRRARTGRAAVPSALSLATLAYRDKFAFAIAPALVTEFMRGGDAWTDYEDLAETLDLVATAFARRFARLQDGR